MSNHRWNKENICVNCGLRRTKRSWKLRMAITEHPPYDHYIYGKSYCYGMQKEKDGVVWSFGFTRPNCNKEEIISLLNKGIEKMKQQFQDAGLGYK